MWKKSTASMVEACVRRNRPHDVSVGRRGVPEVSADAEDSADGGCSDAVAELEKLAVDALVAPGLDCGTGACVR